MAAKSGHFTLRVTILAVFNLPLHKTLLAATPIGQFLSDKISSKTASVPLGKGNFS